MKVPAGIITIFAGAEIDIPAGWVKCDGNNGTPNLEDRFIVGALNLFPVDDSGGSINHSHAFTGDGHFHRIVVGGNTPAGTGLNRDTDVRQVTGVTDSANNLPPYYALIYIMKL